MRQYVDWCNLDDDERNKQFLAEIESKWSTITEDPYIQKTCYQKYKQQIKK